LNEIPKPVIVPLLHAGGGRHGNDVPSHRSNFSRTIGIRRRDDNSRGKEQNVRADSSDENEEIFVRYMNDLPFGDLVSSWMAAEAYRRLRAETPASAVGTRSPVERNLAETE
jgi:hypothetical protein